MDLIFLRLLVLGLICLGAIHFLGPVLIWSVDMHEYIFVFCDKYVYIEKTKKTEKKTTFQQNIVNASFQFALNV